MKPIRELHPEYVIDTDGNKRAVILPIDEYLELLEDLDDLAAIAERREEPTIPHNVVMKELKNNGYLPD
jgi:hypothetical protein